VNAIRIELATFVLRLLKRFVRIQHLCFERGDFTASVCTLLLLLGPTKSLSLKIFPDLAVT
jgi:hypothetical protein